MVCARCGGVAEFTITEEGAQTPLCERCFRFDVQGIRLSTLASGFGSARVDADRCPHCSATREQVLKDGLAGCPLCYEVFPSEVWQRFHIQPQ